jgi:hypothetical protein
MKKIDFKKINLKKINFYSCVAVSVLSGIGILLGFVSTIVFGNTNEVMFMIDVSYTVFVLWIAFNLPIITIIFLITLIKELFEWNEKSFSTVVVPFIVYIIMGLMYFFSIFIFH